jgi:hypothetical protein
VIACEGSVTEPKYFSRFDEMSKRLKVDIVKDESSEQKSAPKYVLDRAVKYIHNEGLIDEDSLWFVIDVDRWKRDQLEEIAAFCAENHNWNLILSNPCFEVWLHLHFSDSVEEIGNKPCKEIKTIISRQNEQRRIMLEEYFHLLPEAIKNAELIDSNKEHYFPNPYSTKMYELGKKLLPFLPLI